MSAKFSVYLPLLFSLHCAEYLRGEMLCFTNSVYRFVFILHGFQNIRLDFVKRGSEIILFARSGFGFGIGSDKVVLCVCLFSGRRI